MWLIVVVLAEFRYIDKYLSSSLSQVGVSM